MAGAGKVGIERRNQHREAVFSAAACRCSRSATQRIRAIYTEVNARMESEALRLGDPRAGGCGGNEDQRRIGG